jgi:acetyl-CoA carboxylase carboxyltransferase component
MSWESEIEEIRRRRQLAEGMGGEEAIARQHAGGKLTVRERIAALLDEGSFREVGALAGRALYDNGKLDAFRPSNFVFGTGRVNGRKLVVGGDDFTVRGGAQDGAIGNKMGYSERMALDLRLPLVRLVDGTGAWSCSVWSRSWAPPSGRSPASARCVSQRATFA